MKNRRFRFIALSLCCFLKDVKEPTLLFIKYKGRRPRWCGTTFDGVGNEGVDASPISSSVTVLGHRGKFKNIYIKKIY